MRLHPDSCPGFIEFQCGCHPGIIHHYCLKCGWHKTSRIPDTDLFHPAEEVDQIDYRRIETILQSTVDPRLVVGKPNA